MPEPLKLSCCNKIRAKSSFSSDYPIFQQIDSR